MIDHEATSPTELRPEHRALLLLARPELAEHDVQQCGRLLRGPFDWAVFLDGACRQYGLPLVARNLDRAGLLEQPADASGTSPTRKRSCWSTAIWPIAGATRPCERRSRSSPDTLAGRPWNCCYARASRCPSGCITTTACGFPPTSTS